MPTSSRGFLASFWRLFKPYWFSEEKFSARLLLFAVVALTLGIVYINVQINAWQGDFYNSLQDKKPAAFSRLILVFSGLAAAFIVMAVYRLYLTQMLQIRWRRWLTDRYLNAWLAERAYYRMQLTDSGTDNPDQRIAEDFRLFVEQTLSLSLGLLNAVVTLVSFIGILWVLSGTLNFAMGGREYSIPGYMVWVALAYASVGSVLAHLIGRPLIGLNFNQQRVEADFRFSLVRFRENAEGVAMYNGEEGELRGFRARFAALVQNWKRIMIQQKRLTWFTAGYGQIAIIFPFVVAAPRYFSGAIPLGGLMQTASAFGQVQDALSWFISAYTEFAGWKATVDRLAGFEQAIERARSAASEAPGPRAQTSAEGLQVKALELALPNGKALLAPASFSVAPGESVLIQGASGSGKSTLFRALAGIWPFGAGHIQRADPAQTLFLPQKAYLPVGSLREVVSFPRPPQAFSDAQIQAALADCKLGHLAERLDEAQNWALQLSPGEQQRIAFARALLIKPRWLFLDEATAALDEPTQAGMYQLLRDRLPDTTVVSIGHGSSLRAFHGRHFAVERDASGVGRMAELAPA